MQTLYIFLLCVAPTAAPTIVPTGLTSDPTAAPATPFPMEIFLFVVVMEVLPHLGHETIPAFLW